MTATSIVETLAQEFSISAEAVQNVFEMVDAGLCTPFIGRFRRKRTEALSESQIRRLQGRREELEELDRRRGTILRTLERIEGMDEQTLEPIRKCMDRFELEDLFVPHRRPEPEVQLALDRGLGALAELLVKPVARAERSANDGGSHDEEAPEDSTSDDTSADSATVDAKEASVDESVAPEADEAAAATADATPDGDDRAPTTGEETSAAGETEPGSSDPPSTPGAPAEGATESTTAGDEGGPTVAGLPVRIVVTPELAQLCQPFVNPDKGIHTEAEALAGAVRILSDRLGRNSHLRGLVRRMLRKRGVLRARPLVDESRAGRHKALLKGAQPMRQVQGHRLLAIRQAQKERVLTTVITLDEDVVLSKVRAALGRHTHPAYGPLLDEVARQSLQVRLLPVVEADVRLELKERADLEALRFLSQHLRQILLTPPLGSHSVVGIDVNARGDWTAALVDEGGNVKKLTRIEVGEKDAEALGAELAALAAEGPPKVMVIGHGKGPRAATSRIREALTAADLDIPLSVVNDVGLSSYANSELARSELGDFAVPDRMAISLARRIQDPMAEILKVDPRHLGLGSEQGLVSKANARRIFTETIESCVAHVGCDINRAPLSVLRNLPTLDKAVAERLHTRSREARFTSREQLRAEGLLSEAQWTSTVAFLRIRGAENPLDATSLHPELYDLARQVLENAGASADDDLGRPGLTKGLRRASFDVDEATWRDLMRELSYPGRDPRPQLLRPEVLDPNTDPARLLPGRVVEGVITSVASFGAFVDVGLKHDAMVHISEVSNRYVRDARELLSIGQVVRAKILEARGQRLSLSLKGVPEPERRSQRPRKERERGRDGRGRDHRQPKEQSNVRAAQTRRDGTGGGGRGGGRRPGGRGPGAQGRGAGGFERGERVNLKDLNEAADKGKAYSPFASFFKTRGKRPAEGASSESDAS